MSSKHECKPTETDQENQNEAESIIQQMIQNTAQLLQIHGDTWEAMQSQLASNHPAKASFFEQLAEKGEMSREEVDRLLTPGNDREMTKIYLRESRKRYVEGSVPLDSLKQILEERALLETLLKHLNTETEPSED